MKRFLRLVVLALLIASMIGTADAKTKKSKPKKETKEQTLTAARPAIRGPEIKPERKQAGSDEPTVVAKPGPTRFGPPIELQLKRAASKRFDLRSLPRTKPIELERKELPDPAFRPVTAEGGVIAPPGSSTPAGAPVPLAPAPPPIAVYEGLDRFTWGAGSPPDTNGDVGPSNFIQTVNTSIGVYRKSDGFQQAAFTFNTFMSQGAFGNLCDTNNFGDPVVLYDTFEDRWIITDFAFLTDINGNVLAPAYQCFAASMTGDPVAGGWNFYSIQITDALNDYPKLGIWPDGLYMSANMFSFGAGSTFKTARAWAFNKAQMYAGSPTVKVVSFDIPGGDFSVMPSNARLQTGTPPPGRPNLFISSWVFTNALTVYKFHVDWNSIPLSTFTGPDVPIAATSWPNAAVGNAGQPGTATLLDVLQIRAMVQNQYTNFGGTESLWVPHTVRRANISGVAAPRWYQINVSGGTVASPIVQATTWDPDAANITNRFMPSLALDRAGNMAMGYSVSSAVNEPLGTSPPTNCATCVNTFPSIMYAGRLAADPINTFSQTEQTFFTGTASQTGSSRWGDYSAMTLDPDGCTFWYTTEYANPADQTFNHRWLTKFGSFGPFPGCTPVGAGGTVSGTVTVNPGGAPIPGATVQLGARSTTTDGSGNYSFTSIPAGTYPSMTASKPGFVPGSASSIVVTDGGTTTQNFSLTAAPTNACLTDTTQADFQTGIPTNVDLTTTPGDVVLTKPDVVDQQNLTVTNSGFGFNSTTWAGQTFIAGATGPLTRADIDFFCSGCVGTTPNLTIAIRAATGSPALPTGPDLATATVPGFNTGAGGYFTATFATPTTITVGTTYAVIFRATANPSAGTYAYVCSCTSPNSNPYVNGSRVTSANSGGTWAADITSGGRDIGFKIFVNTGYTPAGNLISSPKDANPSGGITPIWSTFSWNGSSPTNTSLKFQLAGSNNVNGPFNFVGPDGTAATFFTTSPVQLSPQFYNFRFLEYKALLASTDGTVTPTLNDATACFNDVDCSSTVATITPSPTSVCASSTGNSASGPAGMTSYAWGITNGTITSATNIQTITYTAGASGSVMLTLTVTAPNGCIASSSTPVTINANPAAPTITPTPAQVCANSAGNTADGPAGATTYAWSIVNGTITSAANIQTITYTAGATGTVDLTLVVTNAATCSASNTVNVTINANPATPTITPTPSPVCGGSTGNSAAGPAGATTYAWSIVNGTITSANNIQTITYTAGATGTVDLTLVVTNAATCSASNTVNVPINASPATPTITPTPAQVCANSTGNSASGPAGATTYAWSIVNGTITSAANIQTITYTAGASGTVDLTLVVTNASTCSATNTVNVTINANPATPSITPTPAQVCANSTGNSAAGPAGATTYAWSAVNGTITSATNIQTITYTAGASGTVGLTLVVTNAAGCSATNTVNVTINANPATPTITPTPASVCANSTGNSAAGPAGATTYAWSIVNGTITSAANIQTITYTAGASGTVGLTLVVTNASSCSATNTVNVTINANPATPTITPTPAAVCANSTGNSAAGPAGATTYAWSIVNGTITSATNIQTITYTAGASGTVGLTLVVTNASGCSATNTVNVTINPKPNATITVAPTVVHNSTGNPASVANAGVGATYAWSITNGTITGGAGTASITFTAGPVGPMSLQVTVTTAAGCADTKSANFASVLPVVTVTSVVPPQGSRLGGQPVTINGTGFAAGATVTFGGTAATSVVVVSSIKITATTPAHSPGAVNVTVTNTDTSTGTLVNGYTYVPRQFDANNDGVVDPADIFFLVNYLFLGGPAPTLAHGDANGDGVIDPADIFYIVNFLFMGGPAPYEINDPSRISATSVDLVAGAVTLGEPVLREGRYIIPVSITAAPGSSTPQAMSLRVRFTGDVSSASIQRAGAARDLQPAFETSRRAQNTFSYLVAFDERKGGLALGDTRSAVVAELVIDARGGRVEIDVDPALTQLTNQAGTQKATVAGGTLRVSGTSIDAGRPEMPKRNIN